jgi:hypothetical protein
MTVAVEDSLAIETWRPEVRSVDFEKFAEKESLARQGLSPFVVRKQVQKFVTKDGDATWFETDDGHASFDFGREFIEDLKQESLGTVEHAMVVERPSAAEVGSWHEDLEAGGFKDIDGSLRGAGMEIIVERIRPQEDGTGVLRG